MNKTLFLAYWIFAGMAIVVLLVEWAYKHFAPEFWDADPAAKWTADAVLLCCIACMLFIPGLAWFI